MMNLYKFLLFLSSPILTIHAYGQTLEPSSRLTEYHTAGLSKSIDVTNWQVFDINTFGPANDVTLAFEEAFRQVSRPAVIYMPSGTYEIKSAIYVPSNIVIRGDGPGQTILEINTPSGAQFRDGLRLQGKPDKEQGECSPITSDNTITVDVTNPSVKGSNFIEVADPDYFSVGDNIEIEQDNIASEITEDTKWAAWCIGQIAVITKIDGDRIYLDRTLTATYSGTIRARKFEAAENIGLESFTIETASPSYNSNIGLEFAANCWIKCVESKMCDRDHIRIDRSRNIEISGCYVHDAHGHGAGGFGYGIRLSDHTSDCRVENNIMRYLRHGLIIKEGASRNVFGYNYVREGYYSDGNHFPADISVHGHWAWLNLFEGNIVGRITISDAWGRSGPHNMLFRNRSERSWHIGILEGSSDQILIGNEIIEPYLRRSGGAYFCGDQCALEVPGYCGNNWCGGQAPYLGECVQRNCAGGPDATYIEIEEDPDVFNTVRYANRNYFGYMDAQTTDLPNSYYLCTKPVFFDDNDPWPSIGPEYPISSGTIPARKRWAAYESSSNLDDLFPDCFCGRAMASSETPQSISFCSDGDVVLDSQLPTIGYDFQWYSRGELVPGEEGVQHLVTQSGLTGLLYQNGDCKKAACTFVEDELTVDLGPDILICNPSTVNITPLETYAGVSYLWNTGDTTRSIEVKSPGSYSVVVGGGLCPTATDEILISSKTVDVPDEELICPGGTATLQVANGSDVYWYRELVGGVSVAFDDQLDVATTVDTIVYVDFSDGDHAFTVGPELSDLVPAQSTSTRDPNDMEDGRIKYRVEFTTNEVLTFDEVSAYVRVTNVNTYDIQINIHDYKDSLIGTSNYSWTPTATGHQLVDIPVGITVPRGSDFHLNAFGSDASGLQWMYFRDGGVYPYTDADELVSITRSFDNYCTNTDNPFTYFFDWNFSRSGGLCERVPVSIDVLDCVAMDCHGDVNGSASVDSCGICSGGNTGLVPDASCLDCNGDVNGSAALDNCGICAGGNTGVVPNQGCTDCNGDVNGSASLDNCGVCSGGNTGLVPDASCLDCNGDVNGAAALDNCGICSGGNTGVVPNQGCTDCNGDVNGSASLDNCGMCSGGNTGLVPDASCLDCNGDVNGTAALDNCGVCAGGNTGVVPNQGCTDCNGDVNGSASLDNCGICSGGNTGLVPDASCLDCNGDVNGTAALDNCGVCAGGNTGIVPNQGCTDCNGDVNGSASVDNCGICSGGNTGLVPDASCLDCNGDVNGAAALDNCGICAGGNTGVVPNQGCTDCNGDVNGSATLDNCGVCAGGNTGVVPNQGCTDCNGDVNGSASVDNCGVCSGGNTGLAPDASCLDCNGDVNGSATLDNCGVCAGGNTGVVPNQGCTDCNGDMNGSASIDNCGICSGGNTGLVPDASCLDCNGDVNGSASLDNCGVCSGGNTGLVPDAFCLDCNGDVNGTAMLDNCGVCAGGNTGVIPNQGCTDCNGDVNGSASVDNCGVCSGGNTGLVPDASCLDCNGDVNGSAALDNCGVCAGGNTGVVPNQGCTDCNGDVNGSASVDNCGVCSGGNTGLVPDASCLDCHGDVNGTASIDNCGVCSGGSTGLVPDFSCLDCNGDVNGMAYLDECDLCVEGETGNEPCEEDCAGVLGGDHDFNKCGQCVSVDLIDKLCMDDLFNTFSPNGDGVNDDWTLPIENVKDYKVFNRWGQELFAGKAPIDRWDGYYNGLPLPAGTYYFLLFDTDLSTSSGYITLMK